VITVRHYDIPELYSELIRDDSMINLPSQFASQDSMYASVSSGDVCNKFKKKEPIKDVVEVDDSQ
jgi:hypothetical protein